MCNCIDKVNADLYRSWQTAPLPSWAKEGSGPRSIQAPPVRYEDLIRTFDVCPFCGTKYPLSPEST
jgi:hypothetical protein